MSVPPILQELKRSWRIHVITMSHGHREDDMMEQLGSLSEDIFYCTSLKYIAYAVLGTIKASRRDNIWFQGFFDPLIFLCLCLKRMGLVRAPVMISPRGQLSDKFVEKDFRKKLFLRLLRSIDAHMCVTFHYTSELEKARAERLVDRREFVVAPNVLRLDFFKNTLEFESVRRLEITDSPIFRIGYAGRIDRRKKIDILIRAIAVLDVNVELLIAGDKTPYMTELQSLICDLKLEDRVKFTGRLSGQDLIEFYRSLNLFVSLADEENFGNTFLESLSQETPILFCSGAPWGFTLAEGWGFETDGSIEGVRETILRALRGSLQKRGDIQLMLERFNPRSVALSLFRS